jgi:hypothetical protein
VQVDGVLARIAALPTGVAGTTEAALHELRPATWQRAPREPIHRDAADIAIGDLLALHGLGAELDAAAPAGTTDAQVGAARLRLEQAWTERATRVDGAGAADPPARSAGISSSRIDRPSAASGMPALARSR